MSGEGLTDAIHAALYRPEHGCDGTENGCLNTCPVPMYELLSPDSMVRYLADELEPYVARRESEAAEKALRDAADEWHDRQVAIHGGIEGYERAKGVRWWLTARADSVAQGREETP